MKEKAQIMDEKAMGRAIARISYEIIERNRGVRDICIVGILSRGVPIAQRLAQKLSELENCKVPCGQLDISAYRDDRAERNIFSEGGDRSVIDFEIMGRTIVLVDDVLYTGRSVRAAFDALIQRGRPCAIQLAALVDRGHREFPIRADYVGKNVPTSSEEHVRVLFRELDGEDCVRIYTPA